MPASQKIQRYIWGLFAGRCAFCRELLLHEAPENERSLIGEVAHIVGERPDAARGSNALPLAERNEPDNLLLLCRKHHKIIDDNEQTYSVERLTLLRIEYLSWLSSQLAQASPWKINVSAFSYLNVPRLREYAALQGFEVPYRGLTSEQPLDSLGSDLIPLMIAFQRSLENLSITGVPIEHIAFAHENYIGQLVSFDRLRFRTRNLPATRPHDGNPWPFSGDPNSDPHIYHSFNDWTLRLNIDPRWITTSTAYSLFRPTAGHSVFTGFARITSVDLEAGAILGTALALGQPLSLFEHTDADRHAMTDDEIKALEDEITLSRNGRWYGEVERCDFCGKSLNRDTYMVDGPMRLEGPWGCMCSLCYSKRRLPLGIGKGQLYRRENGVWKLVGGYPLPEESSEQD